MTAIDPYRAQIAREKALRILRKATERNRAQTRIISFNHRVPGSSPGRDRPWTARTLVDPRAAAWALIQFGRLTYQAGELAMNYDDQWQSLRRRSRLWWCLFLGLIPTIILVGFAMDLVSPGLAARSDPSIFFGAWMVAFLTATIYWGEFRCPRCGKRFFRTRLGGVNGFARHCPHCGLRKWSSNEPA